MLTFRGGISDRETNGMSTSQGSVLASFLFNIYTNDQTIIPNTKHFIYADDVAITAQCDTFGISEKHLTQTLDGLFIYYEEHQFKPNPTKTLLCVFRLKIKRQHTNSKSNEKV